jgi:hypothetical protein
MSYRGSRFGGGVLLFALICAAIVADVARAQLPMYAHDRAGNLYEVDPTTGAATFRVATGLNDLLGITLSFDGITYGLTGSGNPAGAGLYRIDPGNGSSVLVGPVFAPLAEGDLVRRAPIIGVTTHLYAVGAPTAGGVPLFQINRFTGEATVLTTIPSMTDISGLALRQLLPGTEYRLYYLGRDVNGSTAWGNVGTSGSHPVLEHRVLSIQLGEDAGLEWIPGVGPGAGFRVVDGGPGGTGLMYRLGPDLTPIGPHGVPAGLSGLRILPEPTAMSVVLPLMLIFAARRVRGHTR